MNCFIPVLSLFGGMVLLFGVGKLIGQIMRLGKQAEKMQDFKNGNYKKRNAQQ